MKNRLETLYFWGRPLSPFYGYIMQAREICYRLHLFRQYTLSVPVISVGNLIMGGTGKTPMVRLLARHLQEKGMQPAIISRGYGGSAKGKVNIVSDGREVKLGAEQAGDEPYMLAKSLPGIPVLTGHRRILPTRYAIEHCGVDSIILDDGFQHISVNRDINIVLFDSTILAGNNRILPGGPLREPISALKRADCFIMTGTTKTNKQGASIFADLLRKRFPEKPVFMAYRGKFQFQTAQDKPATVKENTRAFAFCGIAHPERFKHSLENQHLDLVDFLPLNDHTRYSASIIEEIEKKAKNCGAEILITTEKDYVKLQDITWTMPLIINQFDVTIENEFFSFLESKLKACQ